MSPHLTRLGPCLIALGLLASTLACGKENGTNGVTGPGATTSTGTGFGCRTYVTNATVATTSSAGGPAFNATLTGAFDSGAKQSTVTTIASGSVCSIQVATYSAVADFVDEVKSIPLVFLSTGIANTNAGSCGTGTSTVANTYDSQRRLAKQTTSAGGVTTYTAWDGAGRPTTGTTNTGMTIATTYDDSGRSYTQTQSGGGTATSLTTVTLDSNGNQLKSVVVQSGVTTTTTFTNAASATVCK